MDAHSLKLAIAKHLVNAKRGGFSKWRVGITGDADQKSREHGHPRSWKHWPADSPQVAREVLAYCLEILKMQSEADSGDDATCVYVFVDTGTRPRPQAG